MPGFFGPASAAQQNSPGFIDVGGELFHALAVSLLDALNYSSRPSEILAKQILTRLYSCFPNYKPEQMQTTVERLRLIIQNSRKSELVESMAYVLRQLAVDALYANSNANSDIIAALKGDLRDVTTPFPLPALNALAASLNIQIVIQQTENWSDLHKQIIMHHGAATIALTVRMEGNSCYPRISDTRKTEFDYVGRLAIGLPKPVVPVDDPNMLTRVFREAAENNRTLLHSYQQYRTILISAFKAEELTVEALRNAYTKFFPEQQDPSPADFLVTMEPRKGRPILPQPGSNVDQQEKDLLINTMSARLSKGLIDSAAFFAYLDLDFEPAAAAPHL